MIVTYNKPGVSALAFPSSPPSGGSWVGVYGSEGFVVHGNIWPNAAYSLLPSWITSVDTNGSANTWSSSTSDSRALVKPDNHADRIAACWYNYTLTMSINVNDNNPHQVAVYCLDWDTVDRRQTIDILRQSDNVVLETDEIDFSFNLGVWLRYTISEPVVIRSTMTAGANTVISGLFFDTETSQPRGFRSPPFF